MYRTVQTAARFFLVILFPIATWAQIGLPDIFSDHMVLQRHLPIPVWGTAPAGSEVAVRLNEFEINALSDKDGKWEVTLAAMAEGGPYQMSISGNGETIVLKDILVGEVWLCSGQSNMEWPLKNCTEGELEIPNASQPAIRFFHLKKKHNTYSTPYTSEQLVEFTKGHFFYPANWEPCTPETAAEFSGVAYFFGKELSESLKVPIGLIQNAVGGSPAQSWASRSALASHPQLQSLVDFPGNKTWLDSEIIHPWLAERAKQNWGDLGNKGDAPLPGHPFSPGYLFDFALQPLAPYAIRGAIWYQGESNATHPASYFAIMDMLLKSWRSLWEQGDFPFYFVQLPKIGNRNLWPEFREAQEKCLAIPNTGMAVAIDSGHPTDVHPKEKKVIGLRLARLALLKAYSKKIAAESPGLSSSEWRTDGKEVVLYFNNTYDGLTVKGQETPLGFTLQGYTENGSLETILKPEKIIIEGEKIKLFLPDGFLPVRVKYAWAPNPDNNVVNSAGLPLAPFNLMLNGNN